MRFWSLLYAFSLRLLPRHLRQHAAEMAEVFDAALRETPPLFRPVTFLRALADVLASRLRRPGRVLGRATTRDSSLRFLGRELRVACRTLARQRGFTAAVVLTLALGIGATSAVFSVLRAVVLQPLPYAHPEELVRVRLSMPEHPDVTKRDRGYVSVPWVMALASQRDVFAGIAGMYIYRELGADLTGAGGPERVRILPVSPAFFEVLGVRPALGTGFSPDPRDAPLAILSHALWAQDFGGDSTLIGSTVALDGVPHTVVGVLPAHFQAPLSYDADVWTADALGSDPAARDDWGNHYLGVIGRLAPRMTLASAQARLDTYARDVSERIGAQPAMFMRLVPLKEATVGDARDSLWVLMAAVGLLLATACANVANLVLARGIGRARELEVRVALGAGRRGLLGHLLAESLLLATIGGATGLLVSLAVLRALTALRPASLPRIGEIGVDGTVLLLTGGVTLGVGILFGVIPALRFRRSEADLVHGGGGIRTTGGRASGWIQGSLAVAQVGTALVLLIGAGILVRSFLALQRVPLGFDPQGAITYDVHLPTARYASPERRIAFYREWYERLGHMRGVRSAGAVDWLPLQGRYHPWGFTRVDRADADVAADARVVAGHYFEAAGIPLIAGRRFGPSDAADAPKVAVVSREMAQREYGAEGPLGKRIRLLGREWEIVGVVGDVPYDPSGDIIPLVYLPHDQFADNRNWGLSQVLRWEGQTGSGVARLRSELAAMDPDLVFDRPRSLSTVVDATLDRQRFTLLLMEVFAGTALALATVGLYGVLAYAVRERTHELGIRIALGARPGNVMGLVLKRAMTLAGLGIAGGIAAAAVLTRWLRSLVFQIGVTDPAVVAVVVSAMVLIALAAAYLPARRATRMDPTAAFRDT